MNSQILAKRLREDTNAEQIRLKKHTEDVLSAYDNLKNKIGRKIPDELNNIIRAVIACHDFGKVLPAFQIKKLENKDYQPFELICEIPHSLFSALWINSEKLKEMLPVNLSSKERYIGFVLSAIAYHHWRENFPDFLWSDERKLLKLCKKLIEDNIWVNQLEQNLKKEFGDLSIDNIKIVDFIKLNKQWINGLLNDIRFSEYVIPPYQLYWLPQRIELKEEELKNYIFISGFTILCDHFASFCEEENEDIDKIYIENIGIDQIKQNVKKKIGIEDEDKIWQIQEAESCKDKNVILIAPTGYGKTEFAFLWSNGEKFFYTLPLRSAVNQIFERTKEIFNVSNVERTGILHSDVDAYLLGNGGETENLKIYDFARQLSLPVIVSTGDQFFPYALRPPGYERVYATFCYSRLVIDEVQAYDPKAAAIIIKFIEDIVRMDGKFLLMTATLPKFVEKAIIEKLGNEKPKIINIYDKYKYNLKNLKKHKLQIKLIDNKLVDNKPEFSLPDKEIEKIIELSKNGNRVLVILNTVQQSQDIFESIRKKIELLDSSYSQLKQKIWLLHSRFTFEDRHNKEIDLIEKEFKNPKSENEKGGKILISTQIVEASLDIDCDVLFTEIAPLDALVQRMGRIMRRIGPLSKTSPELSEPNVYIWVFGNGLHSGQKYVYNEDLILLSMKILKDCDLKIDYKEWLTQHKKDSKYVEKILNEIFPCNLPSNQQSSKKIRHKKKKDSNSIQNSQIITQTCFDTIFCEYDKYCFVEKLYNLPDDHSYLKKFWETKDILDAGYMSDRKNDAQKMFREICDIPIISERKLKDFAEDIKNFFSNNQPNDKCLYSKFKKDVLSKYIIYLNYRRISKELNESLTVFNKICFSGYVTDEGYHQRLKRWLSGIYVLNIEYDKDLGIRSIKNSSYDNIIV